MADAGDLVFVVDGPMAEAELAASASRRGGATRRRRQFRPRTVGPSISRYGRTSWGDDDLVYFAEDDYLYRPGALPAVHGAAARIAAAAFFTPYDAPDYYDLDVHRRYRKAHEPDRWAVDGITWRAVRSTTMTFASRLGALRCVAPIHVLDARGRYPRDFDIWSGARHVRAPVPLGALAPLLAPHHPGPGAPARRRGGRPRCSAGPRDC